MPALFGVKLGSNIYKVYVVNKNNNKSKFISNLSKINDNNCTISLDYEFNSNIIGLCQVMLSFKHKNIIFLFHPNDFNSSELELIKQKIYLSNNTRILHGSESLDIPWIFNNVLQRNTNDIIKFISTVIDTSFLCQYMGTPKCSLYELLYSSGTINSKQYNTLNDMYKRNGKIWKINWNTQNMTLDQYKYAAYDVVFLKKLVQKINKSAGVNQSAGGVNLLIEYMRIVFLMRNNIIKFNLVGNLETPNEIIGLKIPYLKKPLLSLLYNWFNDKIYTLDLLDKLNMKLIIQDFERISSEPIIEE